MKLMHVAISIAIASTPLLAGCDRGETPKPAPPASNSNAATAAPTPSVPTSAPATRPAAAAVKYPEDRDVDAARDPQTREKATAMNAIRPEGMKTLKPGDEVVVLVRADSGGALYGSGPYTLDSSLRRAVVHAGVLQHDELGLVRIKVIHFDGDHTSEPKNGITPAKWGKYHASFTVEKVESAS